MDVENKKEIALATQRLGEELYRNGNHTAALKNLLEASFDRVTRKDTKEVLINFGIVYGSALEILKKQKFKILSISPELTPLELAQKLFSHLGYATWNNPSFSSKKTIKSINGLYLTKGQEKLFLPVNKLSVDAFTYLKKEGVKILSIEEKTIMKKKTQ